MNRMLFIALQCICLILPGVEMRTYHAGTSEDLQSALQNAFPGDEILLKPQEYRGDFTISKSGSKTNPITIRGTSTYGTNSKIIPRGTGFHLRGDGWVIDNLSIQGGDTGIKVEGSDNTLKGLAITGASKGIVLEKGNNNSISGTAYSSSGTSVIVSEHSCCGRVEGNNFQGAVHFKGNKFLISGNTGEGHFKLDGCGNILKGNNFQNGEVTKSCKNFVDESNLISKSSGKDNCSGWNVFLYRCWG